MKTKLLIAVLIIANALNAQTTIGFETLTVPASGYYNGQEDYTAAGEEQEIIYEEDIANFFIYATDYGSFFYAHGFVYSNQTDLETADYTNYSAYAQVAGGANGSSNYSIVYVGGTEKITFDSEITVSSIDLTNSTWAYHHMTDTEAGTAYEADDYYKLTITAILADGTSGNTLDFYLADFTNGNAYVIDDWTNVDLSSLGMVSGLQFQVSSSDTMTPYYFCLDNIVYNTTASISENALASQISIYPNPTIREVTLNNIENANISIIDINGRKVFLKENCLTKETINIQNMHSGIYFVKIENNNQVVTKKLIIK